MEAVEMGLEVIKEIGTNLYAIHKSKERKSRFPTVCQVSDVCKHKFMEVYLQSVHQQPQFHNIILNHYILQHKFGSSLWNDGICTLLMNY